MKAFHTSNRALRNCWRMRLMWNVPVLPAMEYDALPHVCIVLYDGVRLVETCVDVCQRMPGTHTYARESRAINAYRETGSPMACPASDTRRTSIDGVNPRHERARHSDLDTSVKSSPLSGDLSAANACLALAADTRGHRRTAHTTLVLAPGFCGLRRHTWTD